MVMYQIPDAMMHTHTHINKSILPLFIFYILNNNNNKLNQMETFKSSYIKLLYMHIMALLGWKSTIPRNLISPCNNEQIYLQFPLKTFLMKNKTLFKK